MGPVAHMTSSADTGPCADKLPNPGLAWFEVDGPSSEAAEPVDPVGSETLRREDTLANIDTFDPIDPFKAKYLIFLLSRLLRL